MGTSSLALRRAAAGVSATNAAGTPTAAAEATISEADATADVAGDPAAAPETTTTGSRCVPQHPSPFSSPPRAPRPPRVAPSPHRNPRAPRKKKPRRLSPRKRVSPRFHPHPPASLPSPIQESLPCAGKEPGRVIGKGGATINRIQDETGARIDVLRDERRVVISGPSDAVRRAVSTVRIVMAEGDGPPGPWSDRGAAREVRRGEMGGDFVEETVPCTGLGPGRVIGKRGATVNRLQDETGARIEVRAEDGRCFVSGTSEQVTAAVEAVRRIIEEGDGYVPVGYDANGVFEGFDPARARGGGGGAGAVEETVQFRSELEVGRIIGKGGATVRHIEDETGVRIQVDKRLMECVVTGGPEEVRRAVRMCERVAEEGFGGAVRVVPCTGAEGAVIGPGGQRVRRLAAETKARIDIEKVDEYESECVIRGSPDAVAAAADVVERLVEDERRKNAGGWSDGRERGRDDSYDRDDRAYYDEMEEEEYYRDERRYYDEREGSGYRRDRRGGGGSGGGGRRGERRGGSRGRGGPRRYAEYE